MLCLFTYSVFPTKLFDMQTTLVTLSESGISQYAFYRLSDVLALQGANFLALIQEISQLSSYSPKVPGNSTRVIERFDVFARASYPSFSPSRLRHNVVLDLKAFTPCYKQAL